MFEYTTLGRNGQQFNHVGGQRVQPVGNFGDGFFQPRGDRLRRLNLDGRDVGGRFAQKRAEIFAVGGELMPRGGARPGAGRKPKTGEDARKGCSLRATAEEWKLHLAFDKIIKYGNKQAAIDFVKAHSIAIESPQ